MTKEQKKLISFVIPMYNEEECVIELFTRIRKVSEKIRYDFELIAVNDHSTDGTYSILKNMHKQDSRLKIISFSRNFGHQLAVNAGLKYSSGDCVIVMDADMQDPPELTEKLLKKWEEGYKVVYGIRGKREVNILWKMFNTGFYRLLNYISPIPIPVDAGDFCLMDSKVVREMNRFNEVQPYIRGLRAWAGFSQTGIKYDRPNRNKGYTKYSYWKSFKLAIDGIVSFSTIPLKISSYIGIILAFLTLLYAVYLIIMKFAGVDLVRGWTTLMVTFTFIMSIQFILIGIIGEYISRIHSQTKNRPLFIVEEEIGFDKNNSV